METLVLWHRALPPTRSDDDDPRAVAGWARVVAARMQAAGGQLLGSLGSAVAVAFDPPDLADGIDVGLELLDEAEASAEPLQVALGAAMGEVEEVLGPDGQPAGWGGSALDRAQLLANRARGGELVLDPAARDAASALYLFGRQVGAGAAALRGQAIDRDQPRRESCRRFIRHLRPAPVAEITEQGLEGMRAIARGRGPQRVVVRGPPGGGTSAWLARLEQELRPSLRLTVGSVPGALEPLGSLRRALLRRWPSADALSSDLATRGLANVPATHTLSELARGQAVPRTGAVEAMRDLLDVMRDGERRAWIILDPAASIDPASFEVLSDAIGPGGPEALLVARLPVDTRIPEPLVRGDRPQELVLPALRSEDARKLAQAVLGDDVDEEVARRVAVLGGDTPLGVEEAARTLVASGDLIYDGRRFVWRVGPRTGVRAIPTEALIEERLLSLEEELHRMLEAVCIVPDGAPASLVEAIAQADGLEVEQRRDSIDRLRTEAFLVAGDELAPLSETLRNVVLQSMPPARKAELCRFMADASTQTGDTQGEFAQATLGYSLAEGGRARQGARALLRAARRAADEGFIRSAMRLAAAAVQFDPSRETRSEASVLSKQVRESSAQAAPGTSAVPPPAQKAAPSDDSGAHVFPDLVQQAIHALVAGHFDTVERCIDVAVAQGCDREAAERMRALAHLARGDHSGAQRALANVGGGEVLRGLEQDNGSSPRRAVRAALTRALILLHGGDARQAIRAALGALATARRLRDPRGEAAAMHTLSACYRTLGRPEEAEAIDDASPA